MSILCKVSPFDSCDGVQVLLAILRTEGVEGLYRGCSAQIFTAVSKSGILLTTKEKIAAFAMSLLIVLGRRQERVASVRRQ